jgi:hypothetical protein
MSKLWNDETRWQVSQAVRLLVIGGGTLALIYYGVYETTSQFAAWLVVIGAIALGMGCSRVWPEPKR